jgi:predicted TIM-barrel fold metal-dependent hydrolase
MMLFDAHAHCFPPLGELGPIEDEGMMRRRLAEHQYHVRFHRQGIHRSRDDVRVDEPLLQGEGDGASLLPEVDFRIGRFGRVEFTVADEDYYIPWMPPTLTDMSTSPELMIAQMDFVGVERAVLQHDRIYGRLDTYLSDCVRKFPGRFVALAQVDEWRAGEPDQVERLRRQVRDLGFRGLYFSTGGFFHDDFSSNVNDAGLEPLWKAVGELGIPIHWYAGELRSDTQAAYLRELGELLTWTRNHPGIPCVLTHGLNHISILKDRPERFDTPAEALDLLARPEWHVELMLHLMNADFEFPPYNPEIHQVIRRLVDAVGSESLVWGSDMPACERTTTYRQSMTLFETQCDFLTDADRAAILGGNLARLYPRIDG